VVLWSRCTRLAEAVLAICSRARPGPARTSFLIKKNARSMDTPLRECQFFIPFTVLCSSANVTLYPNSHSTGRGGVANLTDAHGPDVEHVHHHTGEYESSGRGGSGNIRSPSQPRAPGSRDPSKEKPHGHGHGGVAALWNKMAHPGSHPPHGQAGVGQ